MFGDNKILVPALLGLGIFAQNSEVNLANNTSILLILFLLLKEDCNREDLGGLGRGINGRAAGIGRFEELLESRCPPVGIPVQVVDECGCNVFREGASLFRDEDDEDNRHHRRRRRKRNREEDREERREEFAREVAEEVEQRLRRQLGRIERCSCGERHDREF